MLKRLVLWILIGVVVLAGLAQVIPYGRNHTNPPVVAEPAWDSPETRQLAVRACYDCHSNETQWPWYTNVAPISWLVQRDVDKGRKKLNFSEWDRPQEELGESAESVAEGKMPPGAYLIPRPSARLSSVEKAALIRGLEATLGTLGREKGKKDKDDDENE